MQKKKEMAIVKDTIDLIQPGKTENKATNDKTELKQTKSDIWLSSLPELKLPYETDKVNDLVAKGTSDPEKGSAFNLALQKISTESEPFINLPAFEEGEVSFLGKCKINNSILILIKWVQESANQEAIAGILYEDKNGIHDQIILDYTDHGSGSEQVLHSVLSETGIQQSVQSKSWSWGSDEVAETSTNFKVSITDEITFKYKAIHAQTPVTKEQKDIYNCLCTLDKWYQEGYIRLYFHPEERWYFKGETKISEFSVDNKEKVHLHLAQRIEDLKALGIISEQYQNQLVENLNKTSTLNEGTLLCDHAYGDCLSGFLVNRLNMDYWVSASPEYNYFQETNANMNNEDYAIWHQERISVSGNKAVFSVFYSEIGYQGSDRGNSCLEIHFVHTDRWLIDDIRITDPSQEELMNFYDANIERRGY